MPNFFFSVLQIVVSADLLDEQSSTVAPDLVKRPWLAVAEPQYAGLAPITNGTGSNVIGSMFYWYFSGPEDSPIVLVLEGGPGFSGAHQIFDGCGPYRLGKNAKGTIEISLNQATWTNNVSLLFIDNPLGVGYSHTAPGVDFTKGSPSNEAGVANHIAQTLRHFYSLHSELKTLPLYLYGHSYGGRYAPEFGAYWQSRGEQLAGIIIGNGLMDMKLQAPSLADFAKQRGYISTKQYLDLSKRIQTDVVSAIDEGKLSQAANTFYEMSGAFGPALFLDQYDTGCLTTSCFLDGRASSQFLDELLNTSDARSRLNLPANTAFSNMGRTNLDADRALSSTPVIEKLLKNGTRILFSHGVDDGFLTISGVVDYATSLNYEQAEQFAAAVPVPWGLFNVDPFMVDSRGFVIADSPFEWSQLAVVGIYGVGHFSDAILGPLNKEACISWIEKRPLPIPSFVPKTTQPNDKSTSNDAKTD